MISSRWAAFVGSALMMACSALFHLEDEQCATNEDCRERGGAFSTSVCVSGFCRAADQPSGCTSNAECTDTELCMSSTCTKITNSLCPTVLLEENLRAPAPIVFAIFAPIATSHVESTPDIQNYILALEEWERELPGGPGHNRPFAALVCDSRKTATALPHAVETVGVRAVLAGLSTDDFVAGFESVGRENRVFFLSPYDADSTLTAIDDDSLIWHMLGSAADLAPVYGPLMERIEAHLQLTEPLRVALVENEEIFELDLADEVSSTMTISGTVANSYANFSRHGVSPTDDAKTYAVMTKLLTEVKPHVIISAAGDEFITGVLAPLELSWDQVAKTQRPFYVLSMENRLSQQLVNQVIPQPALHERLLGVNYASAKDPALKNAYLQRFQKQFPQAVNFAAFENHYDAIYFLLYAFVGAGNVTTYSGDDVARGMKRLLAGSPIEISPSQIPVGTAALSNPNATIELIGTQGPPKFDPVSGAPKSEGSVWCMTAAGEPVDDVLRLDETGEQLVGDFSCFDF